MHELSIAQGILEIVQQHVPAANAALLRIVKVRVGTLSGVVPESLDFCFGAIRAGTPWEGARLAIERVAAACRCDACGRTFESGDPVFLCPGCGSPGGRILSGKDLQVVELELDDEEGEVA
jgi:hydrogenase nickel incorporation protein HypA/HybF